MNIFSEREPAKGKTATEALNEAVKAAARNKAKASITKSELPPRPHHGKPGKVPRKGRG